MPGYLAIYGAFAFIPSPAVAMFTMMEDNAEKNGSIAKQEIVVTAPRIKGSVETTIPAIDALEEADIQALGVSSITDVVASLNAQTSSGRGRSSGPPIILVNGQRITNFREVRDLPSDAIRKVEVFPEEVALQYGFRPDQRVINFILKDNFSSFYAEIEHALPTQHSAFDKQEFETIFTQIGSSTRLNIDIELERRTAITEDERNIIPNVTNAPFALAGNVTGLGANGEISPTLSALAGQNVTGAAVPANPSLAGFATNANRLADGNIGQYRTLLPELQRLQTTISWNRILGKQSNISLNASYELQDQQSLIGLPATTFNIPATNPFNPFGSAVLLNRYFNTPRALSRDNKSHALQLGAGFNTLLGDWRLSLTSDFSLNDNESQSFQNADYSSLRAAINNGSINPFATNFGDSLLFAAPDISDSSTSDLSFRGTLSGKPFTVPAGPVTMTLRAEYSRNTINSSSIRRGVASDVSLDRNNINGSINIDIPIIERDLGPLGGLGELSINGNIGITDLSDFGRLTEYGAGLRWSPAKNLSFTASLIGDENAPGLGQLGNPIIVTPDVAFFDFTRGENRFIESLRGGNPDLAGEERRDLKFGMDWRPKFIKDLSLQVEYFRNRSSNTTAAFPLLTPEIEAAFPGRVTRDSNGQLLRVDQRSVNFDREEAERIRWGFNISGNIGKPPEGAGRPGGRHGGDSQGRGSGPGARGASGGGSGGGGFSRGGFGGSGSGGAGGMGSRWQFALYHTYRLEEQILIRAGVPVLDLLNGSAVDSLGGAPRHEMTLSGGVFHKGLGLRMEGSYRSKTRVDGNTLTGSSDLRFDDLANLTLFAFINFDQQEKLIKKMSFLKGSRIRFAFFNVFNDVIDVRDANGEVPLSYQPGRLDPQGRVFEVSWRKRF
jgi:iron complex outermembrane recepter protein